MAWPSCIGFPAVPAFANLQPFSLVGAAGFIELIGGALLILGLLHAAGCLHPLRRDGVRLFHRSHARKGFYPLLNGGTLAHHVLLHLSLSVDGGRGSVER